jgi:hypothetical protein
MSLHFPTSIGRENRFYSNSGEESIHLVYQNLLSLDRDENTRQENNTSATRTRNSYFNSQTNYQRANQQNYGRNTNENQENKPAGARVIAIVEQEEEDAQIFTEEEMAQVTHIIAKGEELLEEDNEDKIVGSSPKILGIIGNTTCKFLVDTGSEVSLISSQLYETLKGQSCVLSELKGGSLMMQGPFESSKKIKGTNQILLQITFGNWTSQNIFIVTNLQDRLTAVIGDNFLRKYNAIINYKKSQLLLQVYQQIIKIPLSKPTKNQSCHAVGSIQETMESTETQIQKIIKEAAVQQNLSTSHQQNLENLLKKHKTIFFK